MLVNSIPKLATILLSAAVFPLNAGLLTPNSTLPQTLAAGKEFTSTIVVPAGQAAEISIVEKQGRAGIVEVHSPDGTEIWADLSKRIPSAYRLTLISGSFEIRMVPANHSPLERIFEVHTSEFHPATEADRARAAAEKLVGEGEQAERKFVPGYRDEAIAKYEAAMAVWTRLGDKSRQADTLCHIASMRHQLDDLPAARKAFQQALDLYRMENDSAGIGWSLAGLSGVARDGGDSKTGLEDAAQALKIFRSTGDLRGEANALFRNAGSIFGTNSADEDRASYQEALALAQRAGDRLLEAEAYNSIGALESRTGNPKIGVTMHLRALAIYREENDPVFVARLMTNLGAVHGVMGEYREALEYFEQAAPILKELSGPEKYARSLHYIALVYVYLGEYQKALDEFDQVLPLLSRAHATADRAETLQGIADVHIALKNDDKAEEYLKQALTIDRAIPNLQGQAVVLNRLGGTALRRGQADEAVRLFRQARDIAHNIGYRSLEKDARDHIADALIDKDPRGALAEVTQSLEASRKLGLKFPEGNELQLQGRAFRRLDDRADAREAFQKAREIRHAIGTSQREAESILELARLDRDEGKLREANEEMESALELAESLRSNIGNREARMRMASSYREYYDLAIDLAMKLHEPAKAFELSERARARSLLDLLAEAKVDLRQGVDPALLAKEREVQALLDGKHDRLMKLLESSHTPASEAFARKEVDQLLERYQSIETEIRLHSPRYAAMAQPQPVTVADIQSRLLDADTQLVEFWLGEARSYAWIVSKEDCLGFELPARAGIEGLARRTYNAVIARNLPAAATLELDQKRLAAARAEFVSASGELSRELLTPMAMSLHSRKLWLVSDGALQYLPFAALPLPGKAAPLVTLYEITVLPSASVLAAIRNERVVRPSGKTSVAIFADPVFRSDDERLVARVSSGGGQPDLSRAAEESGIADLPRLHFSRAEAQAIAALAPSGGTRERLDFDASRADAKKADLGRYNIVHFATHALLNSRHPELSGIVLSMVDRGGHPQDGFLRLHEIYDLKLNADLVVLSGCQTALGQEIRSEGLVGLTRGFMYAGSPQILASLWGVRDSATAEFMRRFYEGLLRRRLTPSAALRETQLSILRDPRWKDPYDWAAFTLLGTR